MADTMETSTPVVPRMRLTIPSPSSSTSRDITPFGEEDSDVFPSSKKHKTEHKAKKKHKHKKHKHKEHKEH